MNLPIGKLFYFVPKIQGYSGGTVNESGHHYAPVGSPGNYPGNPDAGYTGTGLTVKTFTIDSTKVTEPGLDPAGLFDYSKGTLVSYHCS